MPISGHLTTTSVQGHSSRLRGLYAITPDWPDADRLATVVRAAVRGGASVVQVRSKQRDQALREEIGRAVLEVCRHAGALCLMNDDVELAARIGADGVHLGRDDASPAQARRSLPGGAIIGVSCYDDFTRAEAAHEADYVAFGSVFPSRVKPDAVRAPLWLFTRARQCGMNTVAIGGIGRANAASVFAAGADAVAVISDLFDPQSPGEIEQRAREIAALAATPFVPVAASG
jgi:thiamine-phosphate pyrophosphorylase